MMLQRFRRLFSQAGPHTHYVHYHMDDDGQRRFCDESACRPQRDPLSNALLPFTPYR